MSTTDKTRTKTTYHVFLEQRQDGAAIYVPVEANVEASNGNEAVRLAAKQAGIYVAIPARSFQPVTVTVETQTVVKLK
jgi:hypothetical protein